MATPLVIGHRGASAQAPENTIEAFSLAFVQGADGIEADFRLSADGHIICLHDPTTLRTAGIDLRADQLTLSQLALLDVGGWKGSEWAGARIPTLAEVLELLPCGKRIFVELKSGVEIVTPLAALLSQCHLSPDLIRIIAFDPELIKRVKVSLPEYHACWLTDYHWRGSWYPSAEKVLETLAFIGADGLASHANKILDDSFVARLRGLGAELHVWTVDQERWADRCRDLGVDSVITNHPGWLRELYRGLPGAR